MSSLLTPLFLLGARLQEGGAPAEAPPPTGLFGGSMLVPLLLVLVIFWVVMIGPERKARKKREAMLGALSKGDKVMTTSGMYGVVTQVRDDVVTLQVADGVRLRFSRAAIQDVLQDADADDKKVEKNADKNAEKDAEPSTSA